MKKAICSTVLMITMVCLLAGCGKGKSDSGKQEAAKTAGNNAAQENTQTDQENTAQENTKKDQGNTTQEENAEQNTSGAVNVSGNLNEFEAKTMDGETVSADIFKDYDITMVNIWATWCGFCVDELDELQKLYEEMGKDPKINMISICEDLSESPDMAKEIIQTNGCKFKVLEPDENIKKNLLNSLQFLPTTVFVDSKGNIVGDAISGAPSGKDIVKAYMDAVKDRLSQVKK